MLENITKEYIMSHDFACDGLFFEKEKENADFRFAPGAILPMSPEQKNIKLRKMLNELIAIKYGSEKTRLEADTGLNRSTIYKFIEKKRINISRESLAKFCVGAKIPMDTAEELFMLHGYALDPINNLLDAIVVNCIQDKEDIGYFYDICTEKGLKF